VMVSSTQRHSVPSVVDHVTVAFLDDQVVAI
jgi:hypothetical protein